MAVTTRPGTAASDGQRAYQPARARPSHVHPVGDSCAAGTTESLRALGQSIFFWQYQSMIALDSQLDRVGICPKAFCAPAVCPCRLTVSLPQQHVGPARNRQHHLSPPAPHRCPPRTAPTSELHPSDTTASGPMWEGGLFAQAHCRADRLSPGRTPTPPMVARQPASRRERAPPSESPPLLVPRDSVCEARGDTGRSRPARPPLSRAHGSAPACRGAVGSAAPSPAQVRFPSTSIRPRRST
jgi:hypothetical protein